MSAEFSSVWRKAEEAGDFIFQVYCVWFDLGTLFYSIIFSFFLVLRLLILWAVVLIQ